MRLDKPENYMAIGKGGSGKSTLVRDWIADQRRVLIHDTAEEAEIANLATAVIDDYHQLLARLIEGGPFVIAWRGFSHYGTAALEMANRAAWAAEDMQIVWEEFDVYGDGSGSAMPPMAFKIIHVGRHRGLRTITTTRAPALVPKKLTRNVQRIAVFKTDEPNDVRYLAEKIGGANAERIAGLEEYHYLDWHDTQAAGTAPICKTSI